MLRRVALALVLLAPAWSGASSYLWLKTAPARYFTEQDWEIFTGAFERALAEAPDGAQVEWSNEKTGSGGTIQPLSTQAGAEGPCRKVRIDNHAGGYSGSGTLDFCKQADGTWKIVSRREGQPGAAAAPTTEREAGGQPPAK